MSGSTLCGRERYTRTPSSVHTCTTKSYAASFAGSRGVSEYSTGSSRRISAVWSEVVVEEGVRLGEGVTIDHPAARRANQHNASKQPREQASADGPHGVHPTRRPAPPPLATPPPTPTPSLTPATADATNDSAAAGYEHGATPLACVPPHCAGLTRYPTPRTLSMKSVPSFRRRPWMCTSTALLSTSSPQP